MAIPTKYNTSLNTLQDILNSLRYVFLKQNTETVGTLQSEDEYAFWVNSAYMLLENYDFRWNLRKHSTGIVLVSGTSLYSLDYQYRDKRPISKILLPNQSTYPELVEVPDFKQYMQKIRYRTANTGDVPSEFCYFPYSQQNTSYSTGTISGSVGNNYLTGAATKWLANVFSGASLTIGSDVYAVEKVTTDGKVYVGSALTSTYTNASYTINNIYPIQQIDLNPIPGQVSTLDVYYYQRFLPLMDPTDVPLLPMNDRWVLVHGAYSLYQWFNGRPDMSGISPSAKISDKNIFLTSPSTIQKFYDQYVAKILADDIKLTGANPQITYKRGYGYGTRPGFRNIVP